MNIVFEMKLIIFSLYFLKKMEDTVNEKRPIKIEDLLVWAGNFKPEVREAEYDPDTYETPRKFNFRDGSTLQT